MIMGSFDRIATETAHDQIMQTTVPGAMGMGSGALARDDQGAHTVRVNNRSDNEQMLAASGPRSGPGHISR
jgi:hypothetical protein